jgi:hypothetical protein
MAEKILRYLYPSPTLIALNVASIGATLSLYFL